MQHIKFILKSILKNKYILSIIIFVLWLVFFDKNNIIDRFNDIRTLKQLEKEKVYYKERIELDRNRIEELKTDNDNLEKFAREQYLMKKKNEDVFYIVEEE